MTDTGIKVLEKTDTELKVELRGESHGLPNMLSEHLLQDDRIETASYNIDHPLEAPPVLHLRTTGDDPLDVLQSVTQDLKDEMEEAKASL